MTAGRANYRCALAFMEGLARAGVNHLCLAPGSRSAPLALAAARLGRLRLWHHVDERSAAFFALGLARATRKPVALLCTSGTAAANFYPAIIEACYARVPLVVLTADRPHELRDVGAPQSVDQLRLYGPHVRWFMEMPPPQDDEEAARLFAACAARAAAEAARTPAGPVHLNFPLREPLWPSPQEVEDLATAGHTIAGHPTASPPGGPWPLEEGVWQGEAVLPDGVVRELADRLARAERLLLVCGPHDDPELPGAVAELADLLGAPVLADGLSGLRCAPRRPSALICSYEGFLRVADVARALRPQMVVRLGAVPVSRTLQQYLAGLRGAPYLLVDEGGGFRDPDRAASQVLHADPVRLLRALADALRPLPAGARVRQARQQWAEQWLELERLARGAWERALERMAEPFEGRVFPELAACLPPGAVLVAGNSMPVRDLDSFLAPQDGPLRCLANRGASGIDGVVSTALGVAAARVGPVVLVIGDLSFYHDQNGLLAARLHQLSLTVVLVNNDGGGIFHFLPHLRHAEPFEPLFGTPTGLEFRHVVEMYGGRFVPVAGWEEFRSAVRRGVQEGGLHVVELRTDRRRNVELHRQVWEAVAQAVQGRVQG